MILFAAATGLRPGEWIALEQRDIDLDTRLVHVRRTFRVNRLKTTKTDTPRAVPLQRAASTRSTSSPRRDSHQHALQLLNDYNSGRRDVDAGGRSVDAGLTSTPVIATAKELGSRHFAESPLPDSDRRPPP
jgi:integrase